jgi:FMN phosphatase YigB (HAD superfamily)
VIAFDVYDTILCARDCENALPPRDGFADFILKAKALGIKTVTSSDAQSESVQRHLSCNFKNRMPFGIGIFDGFFCLKMRPKNYQEIIAFFGIKESELMVIGNSLYNDLSGAPAESTKISVPDYKIAGDKFSFASIAL